jgi:hypothetical protein
MKNMKNKTTKYFGTLYLLTFIMCLNTNVDGQNNVNFEKDRHIDTLLSNMIDCQKPLKTGLEYLSFNKLVKIAKENGKGNISINGVFNMNNSGKWINNLVNNKKIWILRIFLPEAKYISFSFSEFFIPSHSEFYIVEKNGLKLDSFNYIDNNIYKGRIFSYFTNEITMVYIADMIQEEESKIEIDKILYGLGFKSINGDLIFDGSKSQSGLDCDYEDIACNPEWMQYSDAICKMYKWYSGAWNESGSAVLINNASEDKIPLLLTAKHLVDYKLDSLVVRFKYRWKICDHNNLSSNLNWGFTTDVYGIGATLIGYYNDIALVELNCTIPEDKHIYFAGWSSMDIIPNEGNLLHHPDGKQQKISFSDDVQQAPISSQFKVNWDIGGAQSGSSGGGLFNENQLVIGVHTGHYSGQECSIGYSEKLLSLVANSYSVREKLNSLSGIYTHKIDGIYSDCALLFLKDQTVNTNKSSCKISAYNVTIATGSNVTFNGGDGGVSIYGNFTVPLNTTFAIQ